MDPAPLTGGRHTAVGGQRHQRRSQQRDVSTASQVTLIGNVTSAAPGCIQDLHLVVYDIDQARTDLVSRDVEVSEIFHDLLEPVSGPDPERRSYASYARFTDPDGNGWLLQEIRERLPGR